MPVKIDVLLSATDREGRLVQFHKPEAALPTYAEATTLAGAKALVSAEELNKVISRTDIEITCDNKCGSVIQWCQEEVGGDETAMPDAAFRVLTLSNAEGKTFTYCSLKCLIDAAGKMNPLKSPREKSKVVNIADYKSKSVQKMDSKEGA